MTDYVRKRVYDDGISREEAYKEQKELIELGARSDGFLHCEDCRQFLIGRCGGFNNYRVAYCEGFLRLGNLD